MCTGFSNTCTRNDGARSSNTHTGPTVTCRHGPCKYCLVHIDGTRRTHSNKGRSKRERDRGRDQEKKIQMNLVVRVCGVPYNYALAGPFAIVFVRPVRRNSRRPNQNPIMHTGKRTPHTQSIRSPFLSNDGNDHGLCLGAIS